MDALDEGQVLGAAFDVLPVEKFPTLAEQPWFGPLMTHDRVICSPHVAGWSEESYFKIADVLADKVVWESHNAKNCTISMPSKSRK